MSGILGHNAGTAPGQGSFTSEQVNASKIANYVYDKMGSMTKAAEAALSSIQESKRYTGPSTELSPEDFTGNLSSQSSVQAPATVTPTSALLKPTAVQPTAMRTNVLTGVRCYTIQPGDRLSGGAARLGTSVGNLMKSNPQIALPWAKEMAVKQGLNGFGILRRKILSINFPNPLCLL